MVTRILLVWTCALGSIGVSEIGVATMNNKKGTICDARGLYPSIWSILKPVFLPSSIDSLWLRVAQVPRCRDMPIFLCPQTDRQTDGQPDCFTPCCACGVKINHMCETRALESTYPACTLHNLQIYFLCACMKCCLVVGVPVIICMMSAKKTLILSLSITSYKKIWTATTLVLAGVPEAYKIL